MITKDFGPIPGIKPFMIMKSALLVNRMPAEIVSRCGE